MRLEIIPFLCLAQLSSVLAAPIKTRSTTALEPIYNLYERAFHKIIDRQNQLKNAILDLDPRIEGAYPRQKIVIEERGKDVINGYDEGRKEILGLARNMYPQGGYNFEKDGHIKHIIDSTNAVMDAWVIRKPSIYKAGGKDTILELLRNTQASMEAFLRAAIAKSPSWDVIYGNGDKRFKDYADFALGKIRRVISEYGGGGGNPNPWQDGPGGSNPSPWPGANSGDIIF
jgi:hypothetical protein